MRDYCGGEILRPAITPFVTNYIALNVLLKRRDGLKQMFRSEQWLSSHFATSHDGQEVETLVNNANFWSRMIEPLYEVLRIVDGDRTPTMGLVYAKLEVAKKRIIATSPKYSQMFINIIEDRWDRQISRDLHMAAYYLHPGFQHEDVLVYRDDLLGALTSVVDRMSQSHEKVAASLNELKYFHEGIGSFGDPSVIASRQKLDPGEWWLSYGRTSPTPRETAIRVLSQTSSSSGCERNWSTFALIHTKVRNRLSHRRLDNLVYVHYNMRLRLKHVQMDAKRGDGDYDPTYISYLRDDEDPMVS
ncbi:hypothetical protein Taro_038046 [Colocasia esculenta]|uniref:HAT C-terminal dimerisation domain-containing protein n=1 Tax=Colocasia esculenta TaxID=4460 RepID=A0A843W762_COLES|nr:hypothetical protein [Colocasia esculenta]